MAGVSVEFRIAGIHDPLPDAEVPISTSAVITLRGLPSSARIARWTAPKSGTVTQNDSISLEFRSDVEGPEEFFATVQDGAAETRIPVRFYVKRPFPEN
jgi:hypothetical protein